MERYAIRTLYATRVCHKPGDALLDAAYRTRHYNRVLSVAVDPQADDSYWHEELKRRARVLFLHMRPISHRTVHFIKHSSVVSVKIARSLSEFSNIPPNWVQPLRESRDQVWATADFFAPIYRRNGIDPAKVRVVPEAVDVYDFDPANYERKPITIPPGDTASFDSLPDLTPKERLRRYVFFSNFKWEARKGWDVLLGAYWDAFGPHAPSELRGRTTLVIKVRFKPYFTQGVTCSNFMRFLASWGMMGNLHGMRGVEDFPHVVVLCPPMSGVKLTQLYASADAFVFPSKAEGWGLPAAEAMSMGLPVLLTEWSGLRGFITPDTCFRIPLDGLEEITPNMPYLYEEGVKMALPSREKTAELMRYVLQHPEHARRVGQRARALMMREMSEEAVADTMDSLFIETVTKRLKRL
ncbi:mannosyltransferase-like protein [Leptomonas pyrrhocoris]|uniref:Mannosyltransferase-like protein n=1 Tax=Leptomonas pyrrhocoris TaxID=157538 RepID=A0A0N0DY66_LEPPY|nr:mannosyltransferase-like protein [Leptomonas pyrrhocoris]KPA83772.1 mannosyltransferase-like protein [Leptomonas pyrrhocoris]|eukprot:XP_015662211.1 mannosyltransferase-like protein [Leptomonas pyrrhocoris]